MSSTGIGLWCPELAPDTGRWLGPRNTRAPSPAPLEHGNEPGFALGAVASEGMSTSIKL